MNVERLRAGFGGAIGALLAVWAVLLGLDSVTLPPRPWAGYRVFVSFALPVLTLQLVCTVGARQGTASGGRRAGTLDALLVCGYLGTLVAASLPVLSEVHPSKRESLGTQAGWSLVLCALAAVLLRRAALLSPRATWKQEAGRLACSVPCAAVCSGGGLLLAAEIARAGGWIGKITARGPLGTVSADGAALSLLGLWALLLFGLRLRRWQGARQAPSVWGGDLPLVPRDHPTRAAGTGAP